MTNLANNLRRFGVVNGPKILLHSSIIIPALVQEIAVLAVNGVLLQCIDADFLCKIDGQNVEIALVENLQSLLEALLAISKQLKLSDITIKY